MGASVEVFAEAPGARPRWITSPNTQEFSAGDKLSPGLYTIRVTLAGFFPQLQQHVRINPNLTTMVRIEMESMFASLEHLRRQPTRQKLMRMIGSGCCAQRRGPPDLQWDENTVLTANETSRHMLPKFCWSLQMVRGVRIRFECSSGAGYRVCL